MADFDWKNKDEQDKGSINLLPDELRRQETKELTSKPEPKVEYRSPKSVEAEPAEGKVPWFSFRSWFSKDKGREKKEPIVSSDKAKEPKLIFRLFGRRKGERQALEQAKEEAIRKQIITEVFKKKGLPLPENDNALFNDEQRRRREAQEQKVKVEDQVGRPPVVVPTPPPKVQLTEDAKQPVINDLPNVPPEPVPEPPKPEPIAKPQEPVKPEVPAPVTAKTSGFHIPSFKRKPTKDKTDSSLDVNLIPTLVRGRNWSQVRTILGSTALVTVVILALVYGGLFWWEYEIEKQTTEVDNRIKAAETEVMKYQNLKDQISLTESQIKDIETLLGKHVYWTQFFNLLEKYTIDNVYFDRFSAGVGGNLSLSAHGSNFMSAARQLKLLQQPEAKEFVSKVSVTSVSEEGTMGAEGVGGVAFTIDLQLNNSLFNYAHASSTGQ